MNLDEVFSTLSFVGMALLWGGLIFDFYPNSKSCGQCILRQLKHECCILIENYFVFVIISAGSNYTGQQGFFIKHVNRCPR